MKIQGKKIIVTILGVLIMLYLGFILVMNLWDKIQAKDGFGLVQYVFLVGWSFTHFLPIIRRDPILKNWSWIVLFAGLFLIKLSEYIVTRDLSDLAFSLTLAIIGAVYAYRKRTILFRKVEVQSE